MKKYELVLWVLDKPVVHLHFETEAEMNKRSGEEMLNWVRAKKKILPEFDRLGGVLNVEAGFTTFDPDMNVLYAACCHA